MLRKSRILFTTALSSTFVVSAVGLYWFMGVGVIPECKFRIGTGEKLANHYVKNLGATVWPPLLVPIGRDITLHRHAVEDIPEDSISYNKCGPDSGFVTSERLGRPCINIKMLKLLDRLGVIKFKPQSDDPEGKQIASVLKGERWRLYEEVLSPHSPNEYHLHLRWHKEFHRLTGVRTPRSNNDVWAVDFEYVNTGDLLSNALFKATGSRRHQRVTLEGTCQTSEPKGLVVRKFTPPNDGPKSFESAMAELAVKETPVAIEKR